jgi:outer membrane receptor protein involved in Fe transport
MHAISSKHLLGAVLACCASTTFAQGVPRSGPADADPSQQTGVTSGQLAEVIVTAEKRAEPIQHVPISITAITGAQLQAEGFEDTDDALRQVPGLSEVSAGPGQTDYTLRGLPTAGGSVSTVGFYLDDVPLTAPSGSQNGFVSVDPDLYDISRVEVLRGPQGTLYGSGSMGGTIRMITNKPDPDAFAASAKVDASGTSGGGFNRGGDAMINLPIIHDKLALRLVGTDEYTSGWIDRIVVGDFPSPTNPQCAPFGGCDRGNVPASPVIKDYHDVNDEELKGGRAAIRYQPTERLTITASEMFQSIAQGGLPYYDSPPGTDAHYQPFDVKEPFSDAFRLFNLVGEYDLPAFSITSVTSYWRRNQLQTQDVSETMQTAVDLPSPYVDSGGVGAENDTEIDTTNQFSEEARLTSRGKGPLEWLVGGFFSNYNYGQAQYMIGTGFVPLFGSANGFTLHSTYNIKQDAAFGSVSYELTKALKATVGLRYFSYTQSGSDTSSGIVTGSQTPSIVDVGASNSGVSPAATLSYDVAPHLMVYGTAAKGFRPGSGDGPIPVTGPDSCLPQLEALGRTQPPTQYGPDTVWSYELGEKALVLDRRVTVDSSVYHERWNNVQEGVGLSCGFGFTGNVGTASVWGGESEISIRLLPHWSIAQSVGYSHPILASTAPGTGIVAGSRLLGVPVYTATTSVEFRQPFGLYALIVRSDNVIVGSSVDQYFNSDFEAPSYDIARFRIGVDADSWSAFLFVDNVANTRAVLAYTHDYAEDIPSLARIATNQPRTIGVTFQYQR